MTTGVITPAGEGVIIITGQLNDRGKLPRCHLSNCHRTVTKQYVYGLWEIVLDR